MRSAKLVLASASPRRRELLGGAGFDFVVDPADIEEALAKGETPLMATTRLAIDKASWVARRRDRDELVLGADTSVVIDGSMLGKPADESQAVDFVMRLSGREHEVITAWALLGAAGSGVSPAAGFTVSRVRMREIARDEARAYVAGGESLDKAGGYAAQGEGRRLIASVDGPLDNVIGLPMAEVGHALAAAGIQARR